MTEVILSKHVTKAHSFVISGNINFIVRVGLKMVSDLDSSIY